MSEMLWLTTSNRSSRLFGEKKSTNSLSLKVSMASADIANAKCWLHIMVILNTMPRKKNWYLMVVKVMVWQMLQAEEPVKSVISDTGGGL